MSEVATTYPIKWDEAGSRYFELGVTKGVLYLYDDVVGNNHYAKGVAWNGLTTVTESPSGAEATDLYADDQKYATLRSAESFGATIEAYTYPDEFAQCDGSVEVDGVILPQQERKTFGFCFRTTLGNDVNSELGYKLHLVYNATCTPAEKAYASINDSPDAITMSWEVTTTPIDAGTAYKKVAHLTIDSTKADATKLAALEDILYGKGSTAPRLPLPAEVLTTLKKA